MTRTVGDGVSYQDANKKFTIKIVFAQNRAKIRSKAINSLFGPGISGAVSADDTADFLVLLNTIFNDLTASLGTKKG